MSGALNGRKWAGQGEHLWLAQPFSAVPTQVAAKAAPTDEVPEMRFVAPSP